MFNFNLVIINNEMKKKKIKIIRRTSNCLIVAPEIIQRFLKKDVLSRTISDYEY